MNTMPRLTIGLPVYNGERYLAESIESLLGQSYTDFELIISDNASTDDTSRICERYAKQDSRIRYYRQPRNVGLAPNHNFCAEQARGEFFKWAAADDLYHRDLLLRCVEVLDERPEVVLVHSYTAMIDGDGAVFQANAYRLNTAAPRASDRFRSLLLGNGGDDDGGVDAQGGAAPDRDEGKLPSCRPDHHRRTRPARTVLSGARVDVLPPRPPWTALSAPTPASARDAPIWTPGARTRGSTRYRGCSASTSGPTSG